MESSMEKRFYAALGAVPEVPEGILGCVEHGVRRPKTRLRTALAACLALAVIIPAIVVTVPGSKAQAYADDYDFIEDLFYAFEYLNAIPDGDDLFIDDQIARLSGRGSLHAE